MTQRKSRPTGRLNLASMHESIVLRRIAQSVLYVARRVVGRTFRFIELTLGLQFLVAGQFTSSVLDRAFGLVGGALTLLSALDE
jgi:hypothetical protein